MPVNKDYVIPLEIKGNQIPCHFRFSIRAKNILIRITRKLKIEVIIPHRASSKQAEMFFNQKTDWIKNRYAMLKTQKEKLLLFGEELFIEQIKTGKTKYHNFTLEGKNNLSIVSPENSTASIDSLYDWYLKRFAKLFLIKRTNFIAEEYGFVLNRVSIRAQQTKWGSCSSKKNINLNYKLVSLPERLIDYLIIHELCHLKEMNHSSKYWAEVEKILPDYKKLEKELRKYKI